MKSLLSVIILAFLFCKFNYFTSLSSSCLPLFSVSKLFCFHILQLSFALVPICLFVLCFLVLQILFTFCFVDATTSDSWHLIMWLSYVLNLFCLLVLWMQIFWILIAFLFCNYLMLQILFTFLFCNCLLLLVFSHGLIWICGLLWRWISHCKVWSFCCRWAWKFDFVKKGVVKGWSYSWWKVTSLKKKVFWKQQLIQLTMNAIF